MVEPGFFFSLTLSQLVADFRGGVGGCQEAQNTNKPWILIWFAWCSLSPRGRSAGTCAIGENTTPALTDSQL